MPATLGSIDRSALKQLQDELNAAKAAVPGLKLVKAASGPDRPFPLTASLAIHAAEDAAHWDVQQFTVQVILADCTRDGLSVAVQSPQLPQILRVAMAAELHQAWRKHLEGQPAGDLQLSFIFRHAQRNFASLLGLLPAMLERYEGVDGAGRTQRRVAVLLDTASVEIDASGQTGRKPLRNQHIAAAPAREPARQGATAAALPSGLREELNTIQTRFPSAQVMLQQPSDVVSERLCQLCLATAASEISLVATLRVGIAPTDPEWPAGRMLLLVCTAGRSYPLPDSFAVALGDGADWLSALERTVFDKLLAAEAARAAGRPGALRAVLRFCENHAGHVLHQAADMAVEIMRRRAAQQGTMGGGVVEVQCNEAAAPPPGHVAAPASGEEEERYRNSATSSSFGEEEEEEDEGGSDKGNDSEVYHPPDIEPRSEAVQAQESRRALHLTLDGLDLRDVDALEVLQLSLQVSCTRCGARGELQTGSLSLGARAAAQVTSACSACHLAWSVGVVPKLVHEQSNVLAAVEAEGCAAVDMLPSLVAGQCCRCSSSAAFRAAQIGRWNERTCSSCHQRMAFKADAALFVRRRQAGLQVGGTRSGSQTGQPSAAAREQSSAGMIATGQPLPDHGACRHYGHSYRWLRFPCCGRRYPCDLCHEEAEDHGMKWAGRMVCGYCSHEQTVADRCTQCGKKLAASARNPAGRQTRFWEGGTGQRDQRLLSRRDPHRYRNSRHKTKSNKGARVGPKMRDREDV